MEFLEKFSIARYDSTNDDGSTTERLLADEDESSTTSIPFWTRYKSLIIAHLLLLMLYVASSVYLLTRLHSCSLHGPSLVTSPAWSALEWREHTFKTGIFKDYAGTPNPEIDDAWHHMLRNENIRIEPGVIQSLGREDVGVQVPGEDAFLGTLNVYHELHCLKRIYQYMNQDTYFPNATEKHREMNKLHTEHCIDYLRQSAMCHGDVGLVTYQWDASSRIPIATTTTHQCVDWDRLNEWSEKRSVDMLKPGWLVHPTLGVVFPEGKGDGLGVS